MNVNSSSVLIVSALWISTQLMLRSDIIVQCMEHEMEMELVSAIQVTLGLTAQLKTALTTEMEILEQTLAQ
jgi:hypothetical protein